jgi:hypothetical protein
MKGEPRTLGKFADRSSQYGESLLDLVKLRNGSPWSITVVSDVPQPRYIVVRLNRHAGSSGLSVLLFYHLTLPLDLLLSEVRQENRFLPKLDFDLFFIATKSLPHTIEELTFHLYQETAEQ